ncbi:MAG: 5-formyltetrahydrofolate cyclo-ligase [Rhodospirillaceae bacterium]
MSADDHLVDAKARLRDTAQAARERAAVAAGPDAPARLAGYLLDAFGHLAGYAVSGYLAIGTEIDVAPALAALEGCGLITTLPVVVGRGMPLAFRRWTPETALEPGPLGTRHPAAGAPEVTPDLLLVPMLAFDAAGDRIGWGGGFYDRTLAGLRTVKPVIAVGVGFAGQRVDKVPSGDHDARLDWIATEASLTEIPSQD